MTFYPLEPLHRLTEGYQKLHYVGGRRILLIHNQGQNYLIDNNCPHQGASFEHASISAGCLRCPLHGLDFKLDDGVALQQPGLSLTRYVPIYDGNRLGVEL